MQSKIALCALISAAGLVMTVGCGDSDDSSSNNNGGAGGSAATGGSTATGGSATGGSTATGGDGGSATGGDGGSGGGAVVAGCPTHPNVTDNGGVCEVTAALASPMTQDLTIDATNTWLLTGPLVVGDDSAKTTLTLEAGATLFGGDGTFVLIQRGSQIMAEGTKDKPIVLTSAKEAGKRGAEDWGGLVINGKAPINHSDNADGSAPGEAGTGRYGGTDAADNSGTLKYVRVEFAGNKIDSQNELNGIAFQGVGNGTTVDFVQTHMTSDDGIEFFGGTVNVKHVVVTGADDDSVDWMGGWAGKAQFVIAEQHADSGANAERGIEADNLEGDNAATPYSSPSLSNVTLIGRSGNTANGLRLRRGTKGMLSNFIVTGFEGECVSVTETETETHITNSDLTFANSVFNCTAGKAKTGAATTLVDADAENTAADPDLDKWIPKTGSPALGIGAGPSDSFFDAADYAGAFDGTTDWTDGWLETATK